MQSCNYPPTLSVKSCVLNRACCWGWQTTAGEKKRQKREGTKKGETWEEKSRVGGEWALQQWEQRSKTNPVEEPPLQSDEHCCLTPSSSFSSSCLHRCFFLLLPSLLLLHYSSVCWESLARGSSCCCSSQSTELAGSPPCLAWLLHWFFPTSNRPIIYPTIPRHGDSELALFYCWEREWAIIELLF